MTPAELTGLLGDARPAVRRRTVETLAQKGEAAVPALADAIRSGASAESRRNAVWSATRIDDAGARAAVRQALGDADETTRQAAIHSVSVRRDREALPALVTLLKNPSLQNRRTAAEALGRLGDKSAVPALLDALGQPADRALEHSLTYALIEIGDPQETAAGLKSDIASVRRAALVALDQMDGSDLKSEAVTRSVHLGRRTAEGDGLVDRRPASRMGCYGDGISPRPAVRGGQTVAARPGRIGASFDALRPRRIRSAIVG